MVAFFGIILALTAGGFLFGYQLTLPFFLIVFCLGNIGSALMPRSITQVGIFDVFGADPCLLLAAPSV